jgi:hypothetical protein
MAIGYLCATVVLAENYRPRHEVELTCLAIPKSASLTTPLTSTSKFAPLISLQKYNDLYQHPCVFFSSQ